MQSLIFAIKLISVFLSLTGVMLFAHDRFKLNSAFTPLFAVSAVSLLIYLGGSIGFLKLSALAVLCTGLLFFVLEAVRGAKGKYSPAEFFTSPGIIVFAIFCIFCVFRMKDMQVLHVDNFSHWAVIIKEMCITDSFPVEGTAVLFRNYAPGTASFAYFFCMPAGYSEGVALISHGVIIAASFSALFCKLKIKNVLSVAALFCFSTVTFVIPELSSASLNIYNLLTDGLIAYVFAACAVVAYVYRNNHVKSAVVLIPALSYLTIFKSSARVLVLLLTGLVICLWIKSFIHPVRSWKNERPVLVGRTVSTVLLVLSQFAIPKVWSIYASVHFPDHTDKFPSGASGVISKISGDNMDYVKGIARKMLTEAFNYSDAAEILLTAMWAFTAVVLIYSLITKKNRSFIIGGALFALVCQIVYIGELFILYCFIFDPAEAEILASFYRYFTTASVLVSLILAAVCVYQLKRLQEDGRRVFRITSAVLVCLLCVMSVFIAREPLRQLYDPLFKEDTAAVAEQRSDYEERFARFLPHVPPDSFIMIYSEDTSFFARNMVQYYFLTSHYMVCATSSVANADEFEKQLNVREYILVDSGDMATLVTSAESLGYTVINADADLFAVDAEAKTLTGIELAETK